MVEGSWVILKLIMLVVGLVADRCDAKSLHLHEIVSWKQDESSLSVGHMEAHPGKEKKQKTKKH